MSTTPIIFSAPMVLALLEGRKTMTRRLAWQPYKKLPKMLHPLARLIGGITHKPSPWQSVKPGDLLWVRENVAIVGGGDPGTAIYAANWREDAVARGLDNIPDDPPKWIPSIHMPRWASRLTLEVTATKIEKLQAISEADAQAEGAMFHNGGQTGHSGWRHDYKDVFVNARYSFAALWMSLHGDASWHASPEVVALTFKVHKCNVDQVKT